MAERTEQPATERTETVVRTEVEIEATPEQVWEALVTEQARERWLGESDRDVDVEIVEAPSRLVWWWTAADEPATRVEFEIVAVPAGARVVVTESAPDFPLSLLASSFAAVAA
jgi:uncharacterized protein YndB with AHSA1/START domain